MRESMRKVNFCNDILRKAENVVSRRIDDETVLLNLKSNVYYSMDEIGTYIWEKIDGVKSMADIADDMRKEYEVGEGEPEKSVRAFIDDLKKEKLLETKK